MLRLLRNGMAAAQASGDAALRSSVTAERFVVPCVLCDALDACGVPAPADAASPIDSRQAAVDDPLERVPSFTQKD
jgi:hypothetical protein